MRSLMLLLLLLLSRVGFTSCIRLGNGGYEEWRLGMATYIKESQGHPLNDGGGACGYGDLDIFRYGRYTAGLSSALFVRGGACGGCYELRCVNNILWCLRGSPTVVVTATDFCAPNFGLPDDFGGWCNFPREHFEMSEAAFLRVARAKADIVPVQFRRYSGYCAWRGVFDFTGKESFDIITGIRRAYPELGNCLYFDLAYKTHAVLYELPKNRLNWLWYINGPEPELTGSSVTMKVSDAMVARMQEEAERVWVPELARLIKETAQPFVNVIYDADPLPRLSWAGGRVVLVGDAAHPTTPHGLRSTNMSILDAHVLGRCLGRWESLPHVLAEYEEARLPVAAAQVLHARRLGRLKQGLPVDAEVEGFDARTATAKVVLQLRQRSMPYFGGAPATYNGGL